MSQIILDVPAFSQRDNDTSPAYTCNVTSAADVASYHGYPGNDIPDEFSKMCEQPWALKLAGNYRPARELAVVLAGIFKHLPDYFIGAELKYISIDDMKAEIDANRPFIVHGHFPHWKHKTIGHYQCVVGYSDQGIIVNDPWGDPYLKYDPKKPSYDEGAHIEIKYGDAAEWFAWEKDRKMLKRTVLVYPR